MRANAIRQLCSFTLSTWIPSCAAAMLFSEISSISYAVCSCSGTMWVFKLQAVAERGRAAGELLLAVIMYGADSAK
jgi:hypothetical protein